MKKVTFIAGAAVGYVLGTKAGREKYQQIVDSTRTLHEKPVVQRAQSKIKDLAGQGTTAVSTKLGLDRDDADSTTTSLDSEPTSMAKAGAASTKASVTDPTL
jgi:hypothetical protein